MILKFGLLLCKFYLKIFGRFHMVYAVSAQFELLLNFPEAFSKRMQLGFRRLKTLHVRTIKLLSVGILHLFSHT